MIQKTIFILWISLLLPESLVAKDIDINQPAILMLGASFQDSRTPFNDDLIPALGGVSVGFGSYLPLGNALIRNKKLPGFVINEAQAGATSFDRRNCTPAPCGPAAWQGYDKQFTKALTYVTMPDPEDPNQIIYNADYVLIPMANDCMHSGAFDKPQEETEPCSIEEVNDYIDRLIEVGERALTVGITPIYDIFPRWDEMRLDIPFFGLLWRIDEDGYNEMRELHMYRISTEMPEGILLNMWKNYVPLADGLHPNYKTTVRAAKRLAKAIIRDRARRAKLDD